MIIITRIDMVMDMDIIHIITIMRVSMCERPSSMF